MAADDDEVERLRELLLRWLRLRWEVLTPEELDQLYEDTRRALAGEPPPGD
jgi:hypothetical protein